MFQVLQFSISTISFRIHLIALQKITDYLKNQDLKGCLAYFNVFNKTGRASLCILPHYYEESHFSREVKTAAESQ